MVAGLLYIVGLIVIVVTVVVAGANAPLLFESFSATMGSAGIIPAVTGLAAYLSWTATPLLLGLVLMGLGRIIMLLDAINRALRGTP